MASPSETNCPAEMGSICARRHWAVYGLLITLAFAAVVANILHLHNPRAKGDSPFFSANDRSRWCTIYSLVHQGTYAIDERVTRPSEIHWDTIDKVQHVGIDGRMHEYSSKPTLLPTMLAGEYWLVRSLTGWDLDEQPKDVVRVILILSNAIPFALMLCMLAAILEPIPVSDWVRYFIVGCAGFGTFLTPFCITINNHLPAAVATMAAIYCVDRIFRRSSHSAWWFLLTGLATGFATANELPALLLAVLVGLVLMTVSPARAIVHYTFGFAVVVAGMLGTNWLAHGEWKMPYMHRTDGPVIETFDSGLVQSLNEGILPEPLLDAMGAWCDRTGAPPMESPQVERGTWMGQKERADARWVIRDSVSFTQFAVTRFSDSEANGKRLALREWSNWYDFPGSYWSADNAIRSAVDNGESSKVTYGFHMAIGHHGIVSLTPIWLLSLAGMFALVFDWRYRLRWLGLIAIVVTATVFVFYLTRPEHDRNYGGVTSGLRWAFWLIPIWLVTMAPVVQLFAGRRWGRWLMTILLLACCLSASYSRENPWVHPWLYQYWETLGLPADLGLRQID